MDDTGGIFYLNFSGQFLNSVAHVFAPKPDTLREMLVAVRCHFKWPQAYLAAMLGVPTATLRGWEKGQRNPSRAAKKLIWLLHALLLDPGKIRTHRDIACWGGEWGFCDINNLAGHNSEPKEAANEEADPTR